MPRGRALKGRFFSFEGIDGSGKTTQLSRLAQALRDRGFDVETLREPGGTGLGERIRSLLLDRSDDPPVPVAELLLFSAARAQIVGRRIRPALERGAVVLLDRFSDATYAYQGHGRGIPLEQILSLEDIAAGILPDRTWFLDLSSAEASRRRGARGEAADRMESETDAFREKVREGYLERASLHPERIRVVDAGAAVEVVAAVILSQAIELL